MMIPALLPGASADRGVGAVRATSDAATAPAAPPEAIVNATPRLVYEGFAAALKGALRDFRRSDLLARNPLSRDLFPDLEANNAARELQALLSRTVAELFGNPRDDRVRRILELTYFEPGLKQEVVAERLALSFGTYRRHLTAGRERLARWLWECSRLVSPGSAPSRATETATEMPSVELRHDSAVDAGGTMAPRLSLVVLPFLNIGGTAEDEAFVDGVTETLTTDLSRGLGIVVISRNTAFAYKGSPIDSRKIGRELGVRFVLEGSVQNAGDSVRINVQLVDAENGAHLWAERFDKQHAGLLEMQDEVVAQLSRAICIELVAAESRRAAHEPVDRLDTVDHALRGWAAWNQRRSREVARQARASFEAALCLDGSNISALLGLADTHIWEVNTFVSEDRPGQIRAAEAAVKNALELAPRNAAAHLGYGRCCSQ